MVAERLYDAISNLEAWGAMFEALAAVVAARSLPELGGEVGPALLQGNGIAGRVYSDTDGLEVRWVVDWVSTPLVEGAWMPARLSHPMDGSRNGSIRGSVEWLSMGGPMDFEPCLAE